MTKDLLRKTAQIALGSEYGFKPSLGDIVLLEGSDDRTYIRFTVKGHEYVFRTFKYSDGGVWCGRGTIEKVERR